MNSSPSHLARSIHLALATVFVLGCVLALPALASASDYVVNTLNDEYSPYGCEDETECTLRTAISKSNEDEDLDTIEFSVEGTIELDNEPLPWIFHPVVIDGTTLPNYNNKPRIGIDGANAQSEGATEGLSFLSGSGGSSVEGVSIGGFDIGVELAGQSSVFLCASSIGLAVDGVTPLPNTVGVETGFHSPAQKIGSECWDHGGNLISGNDQYGIVDFGTGTKIAQNKIGLDVNGDPVPNGTAFGAGILVSSSAEEPYIGGFPGEEGEPGNVIAHNAGTGVLVEDAASNASIRRNRIYGNTQAAIKINSGTNTPSPLVEFGQIVGSEEMEAFGTLHAKPEHEYVIDIFASSSCYENSVGQGEFFLGSTETTTDSGGQGIFDENGLAVPPAGAEYLTGTATDLETGSTSQIGLCIDPPPFTELTTVPDNPLASTTATFEFTGHDPNGSVAGFQCNLDGGGFGSCSSPLELTNLQDGLHTFEVRAVDQVGLIDFSPATYSWTVDTTAPTVAIQSTPSNPTNVASASFAFTANDAASGIEKVECKLDGSSFAPCSSPAQYNGLADGSHTFEVKATDKAGHSSSESFTWTVDEAAPTTTLEGKPASLSTETGPSFTFSGADAGGSGVSGFECKIDNGSFGSCSSPDVLSGLTDGSYTFQVRAKDNAGNVDATPDSYSWTVDTTAPTTTIDSKPPDPSGSASPSFAFSGADGGSGLAGFECKLDQGSFAACTSPKALSGLGNGSHTFQVRAKDKAGNLDASPDSYTWAVDTNVPAAPQLTATDPASPANQNSPTVIGSAPPGTTVSIYKSTVCSGAPVATVSADELALGVEVTVPDDAITQFTAKATSASQVTSTCSAALSYREDSTEPDTQIDSPTPTNPSKSNTASFFFSGTDPGGAGVARFECRLDEGAFAACTSPIDFSALGDGSHHFEVRAIDAAGNTDPSNATYDWRVDTSTEPPPETRSVTPSNGESVAVAPEGGKVLILRPGDKKPTELKEGETIPVGSLVDATNGKVLLTSVNAAGEEQSAYFFGGKFLIQQHDGSGLVILKLRGDLSCGGNARKSDATASGKKSRKLWGSGHGNFRTEGSYGSATVMGTIWLTEDRCEGTYFKTRRGVVKVRDFTNGKTISLPAGKTYIAQP